MAYHLPKDPEPCPRCGRLNCDELEPGEIERLGRKLSQLPEVEDDSAYEGPEPLL